MKHETAPSSSALKDLERHAAEENIVPFWTVVDRAHPNEPQPAVKPYVWKWETLNDLLQRALLPRRQLERQHRCGRRANPIVDLRHKRFEFDATSVTTPRVAELIEEELLENQPALRGGAECVQRIERLVVRRKVRGVERALVALGGDIVVGQAPPGAHGWRITVEHADSAHADLWLERAAVSSSGDTEQFVELGGRRYSHVVDPRTGLGLTHRVAATVVAPDGTSADAYATAVTILDPERRAAFIAAHPEATFYVRHLGAPDR